MKKMILRIGKFLSQAIAFCGGLMALLTFIFGGRDNFIEILSPYFPYFPLAGLLVIFLLLSAIYVAALVWIGRDLLRLSRRIIQLRRDKKHLSSQSVEIARLKQDVMICWFQYLVSTPDFPNNLNETIGNQKILRDKLLALGIAAPENATTSSYKRELIAWGIYLEMLLPLAVAKDVEEARLIMWRIGE